MAGSPIRQRFVRGVVVALTATCWSAVCVQAQHVAAISPAPARATQTVTVNMDDAPLETVVRAIASQAKLLPIFNDADLPTSVRVTLHVHDVHVEDAFRIALKGTGLIAQLRAESQVAILRAADDLLRSGIIAGVVTNAKTKQPVRGAFVTIDDSVQTERTDEFGRFRFVNVSSGSHRISVRAIGFARQSKLATANDDKTSSVDFVLEGTVNTLDRVVVTATGEQLYRQLGHEVTHLNADSLVKNAPITNVAELLTARVPGLQVMQGNGGMAGGEFAIQIRGQTTTSLDPQPIVIVDGVRYRNTNGIVNSRSGNPASISEDFRPFNAEPRSPLNDLNVNDIESVEVVKGPSASTLYGPDAANGVIVITTKRARAGKTEWHIYAHPRLNDITNQGLGNAPPRGYWAWGHDPVTLATVPFSCELQRVYYQQCVQDSITIAPLFASTPDFNIIAQNRPQWQYGANVSGGSETLRYFLSAGYDNQVGSLHIPEAAASILKSQYGSSTLSDAIRDPNSQQTGSLHSDIDMTPTSKTTLRFSLMYSQTSQRSLDAGVFFNSLTYGVPQPGCAQSGDPTSCSGIGNYPTTFLQTTQEQAQRITGSLSGSWQALSWVTFNANVGTDLDGTVDRGVRPYGSSYPGDGGQVSDYRRNNSNRTAKVTAVAQAHPGLFSFRTSLGLHYDYTHLDGINTDGQNLAPGSTSISTAGYVTTQQLWAEQISLGGFGEEVFGVNDRFFLTTGLRLDGSTSFGDAYHARPFPNVGASWIASDEPFLRNVPGLQALRFRISYGASSRYPTSQMKFGRISANQNYAEGVPQNVYTRDSYANPILRPERSSETEYGIDFTLFRNIVDGKLTWHHNRTNDQLQDVSNPTGLRSQWQNVGDVASRGFEASVDMHLLDTRFAQGTLTLNYSLQRDKLVSVGSATPNLSGAGVYRVGYPLSAVFDYPTIGYADTLGGSPDGIIVYNEVVRSPTLLYLGVLVPPKTYGVMPQLTFLHGRLRVSTAFDRQTGFIVADQTAIADGYSLAPLERGSSLLAQAIYVGSHAPYVPGDFTRWRELNVGTDIPPRLLRLAMMHRGSVNFQVRNLGLWTKSHVSDPEVLPGLGTSGVASTTGYPGIPLARVWTISFDVTP